MSTSTRLAKILAIALVAIGTLLGTQGAQASTIPFQFTGSAGPVPVALGSLFSEGENFVGSFIFDTTVPNAVSNYQVSFDGGYSASASSASLLVADTLTQEIISITSSVIPADNTVLMQLIAMDILLNDTFGSNLLAGSSLLAGVVDPTLFQIANFQLTFF